MSMNLDDIKHFKIIADTLNITRASELIGISQPALSYSLKRLEKEAGAELIARHKNGVQLTKYGEEFLLRSGKLIHYWEESQDIFSTNKSEVEATFSIGAPAPVAIFSLNDIFNSLNQKYPLLNYNLVHKPSRELSTDIINWNLDFGIIVNPVSHPDLVIKELGKDIVTWFQAKKTTAKIIYNPLLAQSRQILKKINFEYQGHIHTRSLELIAKLTSRGQGYGLIPSRVAAAHKNIKRVKDAPQFKDRICLVYRKEKHKNPVSREIIEELRKISF